MGMRRACRSAGGSERATTGAGTGVGGGPVGGGLRVVPADEFLGQGGIATTRLRRCLLPLSRSRRTGRDPNGGELRRSFTERAPRRRHRVRPLPVDRISEGRRR